MSPRAWISVRIFRTNASWAGSVVRTKWSYDRPTFRQVSSKATLMRSTHAFGSMPCWAAASRPPESREHVGDHERVGVADVRLGVRVEDRGCEVERRVRHRGAARPG